MPPKVFFAFSYRYAKDLKWYPECLRQTCVKHGCEALFASDIMSHGHVLAHVAECIDQCELGFYDITGLNSNVLVEYGIGYNADKPSYLLINPERNVEVQKGSWGSKEVALTIPSDLEGILRLDYLSADGLSHRIGAVLDQTLHPSVAGEMLANRIVDRLGSNGASNMSAIALAVGKPIDEVRPILKALIATGRVVREGHAKGSKYRPT